ncbi:hypothetical protein [Marasmitruncus massiliensis]|uniref:hypothetical protein n=1 Tax=Marasmitruncus massiliensis TaxID=1944642 RepID=UPI000C7D1752|nr:hypothetical protein [Marasmitruncus massiliensis]
MDENMNDNLLLIDDMLQPPIGVDVGIKLKPIQKQFMQSYIAHKDEMPVEKWLIMEMKANLPEKPDMEIAAISSEIISTIKTSEEKKASLEKAIANGRSKESWFASEAKNATSFMSAQEASTYLKSLDKALNNANESLYSTISTQAGVINLNPHLDGFIAEQYHAQTFNLNAEATGSQYRAKVLQPDGTGYTKNSVDVVIMDDNGKVVKRYQSKYCKDAEATAKAFDNGDYRGQQKLVPEDQSAEIQKKNTTVLEAPDGTTSNPLTKQTAKELQKEAQSGNWNDLNWNNYRAKDLALGIGKQAGQAALLGASIGVGFDVAQKVWSKEEINGEEIVETALSSGADFGVKAAAAGALKVGAEKGIISVIPKGTPAGTIANIAFVAVENAKVIGKMATGELTVKEGMDKMEQVTVSTVAGISTSVKGAALGATIGTVCGPIGTAVGGFIGGTVGYMAGSKIGETIAKSVQKIRENTREVLKSISGAILSGVGNFCSGVTSFCSLFGW